MLPQNLSQSQFYWEQSNGRLEGAAGEETMNTVIGSTVAHTHTVSQCHV